MGLGETVKDFIKKLKGPLSTLTELIKSNTKMVIIIAIAFLVILLLLLVLAVVSHFGNSESGKAEQPGFSTGGYETVLPETAPGDDFFLPYEPDFVPDVLLERDPRDGWTEEDARPFWTDPLEGNEEVWRRRIESGIDSLLENVP